MCGCEESAIVAYDDENEARDGTLELVAKVENQQPNIAYDLWGSLFKLAKLPVPQFIQSKMQCKAVEQKALEVKASAPVVSVARRKSVPTLFRFQGEIRKDW